MPLVDAGAFIVCIYVAFLVCLFCLYNSLWNSVVIWCHMFYRISLEDAITDRLVPGDNIMSLLCHIMINILYPYPIFFSVSLIYPHTLWLQFTWSPSLPYPPLSRPHILLWLSFYIQAWSQIMIRFRWILVTDPAIILPNIFRLCQIIHSVSSWLLRHLQCGWDFFFTPHQRGLYNKAKFSGIEKPPSSYLILCKDDQWEQWTAEASFKL